MMNDRTIIELLGFVVTAIAVITPVVKLNANIVKLQAIVETLEGIIKDKTDELNRRVTDHGNDIDDLQKTVSNHEARIVNLEK